MASGAVTVDVQGRRLRLSNLDKVLYPATGFTKGEVIDYYSRIAPVLLPHLAGRPLTMRRWPDGVAGQPFYDKDASRHAPDWLRVARLPTPGSTKAHEEIGYAVVDGLPALVWAPTWPGWSCTCRNGRWARAGSPSTTAYPISSCAFVLPGVGRRTTRNQSGACREASLS